MSKNQIRFGKKHKFEEKMGINYAQTELKKFFTPSFYRLFASPKIL
jgi:hypothetical protein